LESKLKQVWGAWVGGYRLEKKIVQATVNRLEKWDFNIKGSAMRLLNEHKDKILRELHYNRRIKGLCQGLVQSQQAKQRICFDSLCKNFKGLKSKLENSAKVAEKNLANLLGSAFRDVLQINRDWLSEQRR
jgi:hypothetical protein